MQIKQTFKFNPQRKYENTASRYSRYLGLIDSKDFDTKTIADRFIESLSPDDTAEFIKEMVAVDLKIMCSRYLKAGLFDHSPKKNHFSIGPNFIDLLELCDDVSDDGQYLVPIGLCNLATGEINKMEVFDKYFWKSKCKKKRRNAIPQQTINIDLI